MHEPLFLCFLHAALKWLPSDPLCISNSRQWSLGIQSPKPPRAFQQERQVVVLESTLTMITNHPNLHFTIVFWPHFPYYLVEHQKPSFQTYQFDWAVLFQIWSLLLKEFQSLQHISMIWRPINGTYIITIKNYKLMIW